MTEQLILEMIEEVLNDKPSLEQLFELNLVEELSPSQTLWRSMTSRQATRIRKKEIKTEAFSNTRAIAELYKGNLFKCNTKQINKMFKMNQEGVFYLINMALESIKQIERVATDSTKLRIEQTNCLIYIFRIIVATGCFLLDKKLHRNIFTRLGFKFDYSQILGTNPKDQHKVLYQLIQLLINTRINDCIRHTDYWVDIPLINDYTNYIFTLPGMLKPLGINGIIFYFDEKDKEYMIFSGPQNPIKCDYICPSTGKKEYYLTHFLEKV